uniref:Uncharacterized protein n=1 Tax=Lepeophtheirus salmonis TaxID=72036 RepID=A0A0K2ULJ3_LEPSM
MILAYRRVKNVFQRCNVVSFPEEPAADFGLQKSKMYFKDAMSSFPEEPAASVCSPRPKRSYGGPGKR